MSIGKVEFSVNITNEEVVAATKPMQEHRLALSNLDLLLPPVSIGVFFCYNNPVITIGTTNNTIVGCLKNSLAEALVSYYAFAGEMVTNSMGEPELLCNNYRGVDFVEAFADVELQSLNLHKPEETIEGKLVPKKKHGVLAVQATWMKCGGLIVGCNFDHQIADAYSTNMFLVSWAEIARSSNNKSLIPTTQPCFQRSLLTPRHPPFIHPSLYDMYIPISDLPPPPEPKPESDIKTNPLISRIYYVTSEELNTIQLLANTNNSGNVKRSKLESFSAFLWKMVASAASTNSGNVVAKIGLVVDGRKRLSNGDKNKEEFMSLYFGNVLSTPYSCKLIEELVEKPLCWVTEQIHEFLEAADTKEHFLGLIDWVEEHRPVPGLARIYCGVTGGADGPTFVVSSGQRFPESKVDFGWGKPVVGSYHIPCGGDAGYVMPMPSPKRNGDWLLYMNLPKEYLHFMEAQAHHFFRPISWDYLLN